MICNENLAGIPLLILANKQDIPDCMGVREVKPIFNENAHLIGRRDFMVMPISALTGWIIILNHLSKLLIILDIFLLQKLCCTVAVMVLMKECNG